MRFLIISFFFILLFLSCGNPVIKGLPEHKVNVSEVINPYFSNANTDYVYKAKINAFDNVFGGILIIKKIKSNNHRIVFTTNFGNKIFDFELFNNEMKIHYIMENLNRKIIINTLKNDFETIIQEHNPVYKTFEEKSSFIYQSKLKNGYNYYVVSKQTQELFKIINASKTKEKINCKNHKSYSVSFRFSYFP